MEEIEEDLPWIQEKALDIVEFSGSVTQALPGPRIGRSSLPLILAVPLAYVGISFVIAVVKTFRKFTSPKHARRRLVRIVCSFVCASVRVCVFSSVMITLLIISVLRSMNKINDVNLALGEL